MKNQMKRYLGEAQKGLSAGPSVPVELGYVTV